MAGQKTPGDEWTCLNYMSLRAEKMPQSQNSNACRAQQWLISQGEEILVKARIVRQLGVKRCGEEMALLRGDDPPIRCRSEHLRISLHRLDNRCADEDRVV